MKRELALITIPTTTNSTTVLWVGERVFRQGSILNEEVAVVAGRFSTMAAAVASYACPPEIKAVFEASSLQVVFVNERRQSVEFGFNLPHFVPFEWTACVTEHMHQTFIPQARIASFKASFQRVMSLQEIAERTDVWAYAHAVLATDYPSLLGWVETARRSVKNNTLRFAVAHPVGVSFLNERNFSAIVSDLVRDVYRLGIKVEVKHE